MTFVGPSTTVYLNNTNEQFIDLTHFVIEGDDTECCIVEIVNTDETPYLDQEQPMTLLYQQLPESQPAIVVQQPSIVEAKDVTEQVLDVNIENINNNEDIEEEEEGEERLVIVETNDINDSNEEEEVQHYIITTVDETVSSIVAAIEEIYNDNVVESEQSIVVNKKPTKPKVLKQPKSQSIVQNQRPVRERKIKHHHNCLDCEQCKPANVEEAVKKKEEPTNKEKVEEDINLNTQMLVIQEIDAMKMTRAEIASKHKIPNSILNYIISNRNTIEESYKNQYINMLDLTPNSNNLSTTKKTDTKSSTQNKKETSKTTTKNKKVTTSKNKSKSNVQKNEISKVKLNLQMKKKQSNVTDEKVTKVTKSVVKSSNNTSVDKPDSKIVPQASRQSSRLAPQKIKQAPKVTQPAKLEEKKEISKQNNIDKTKSKKTTLKVSEASKLVTENKTEIKKSAIKNKTESTKSVSEMKKEKDEKKVEVRQVRTSGRVPKKRVWSPDYELEDSCPMVVKMFHHTKKDIDIEYASTKKRKCHFTRKSINLSTKMLIIDEVDSGLLTRKDISIKYGIPFPTLTTIMNHRDKVEKCFKLESKIKSMSYDMDTKLKVLAEIDKGIKSKSQIAKQFHMPTSTLSCILNCRDKILNTSENLMLKEKSLNNKKLKTKTKNVSDDSMDLYTKIEILKHIDQKKMDKKIIAEKFNVSNATITNIIKHREKIENFCQIQNVANIKFRSSPTFEIERRLLEYWLNYDGIITNTQLCVQAVKYAQELGVKNFKCHPSCAWIWRFKKRFKIKTIRTSKEDLERMHQAIQKHQKEKTPGKFMCDICKCEIKSAPLMEKHIRLHHFPTSFLTQ